MANNGTPLCPIHKVRIYYHEKDGHGWWSHKLDDGTWCYGKPKKKTTSKKQTPTNTPASSKPKQEQAPQEKRKLTLVDAVAPYVPQGQNPAVYLKLVKTQVLGVDSRGQERPTEDLLYFLYVANKAGLDPLSRQIYAVYRWDSRLGKEKMTIQTSIDGLRLVAQRSGLYGGQDDVVFDTEKEPHPNKATVTVYRLNPKTGERMPVTASARWSEYVQVDKKGQVMGLWKKMPYLMLGKVAEALALRKAFPAELSGLYTTEEMAQADNPLADLPAPTKDKVEEGKVVDQQEEAPSPKHQSDLAEKLIAKRQQLKEKK